jgi:hypothetical protein
MEAKGERMGRRRKTKSAGIKLDSRGNKLFLYLMNFGSLHHFQDDLQSDFSEAVVCNEVLLQLVLG